MSSEPTKQDNSSGGGLWGGYSEEPTPLGAYSVLLGSFWALFASLTALAGRSGRCPRGLAGSDIALLGVATHKITRLVTKDWVTSPLRAPFVEYVESAGGGEVKEKARGTGMRKAVGDLFT